MADLSYRVFSREYRVDDQDCDLGLLLHHRCTNSRPDHEHMDDASERYI